MSTNHSSTMPPTQILFRGAAYRLRLDPIERDADRVVSQVVMRELQKDTVAAGESAYQESPFQPTSQYVEQLTPVILAALQEEGYTERETSLLRPHVEDRIIKLVEDVLKVYADVLAEEEENHFRELEASAATSVKQLRFKGSLYRLAQHHLPRVPMSKTKIDPKDYLSWKRCILEPVEGQERDCDKLAKTRDLLGRVQRTLDVLESALVGDNPQILGLSLNRVTVEAERFGHEFEGLKYLGQRAHIALKGLHSNLF